MKLHIKYMVSNRCKLAVKEVLKKFGLHFIIVDLGGPTDAKVELFNLLKADHHFAKIKIEVKQADKMTENQQHAFVREHFSRH